MNTAIFLGSFNPAHKGHYSVVKSVIDFFQVNDEHKFDKIHVIPCWQNPNKSKSIDFYDRYKMCKYEFASLSDNCFVDDIEAIVKPTYTYELIDYFKANKDKIIGPDFWWIITEETFKELIDRKWKESERLLNENKFIIVTKNEIEIDIDISEYCEKNDINRIFVPFDGNFAVHSTQIRENFWVNAKYDSYITKATKEYIVEHNLYR